MDYKSIYNNLISTRKKLNRRKSKNEYYELHHIVPRSFGGSDDNENLILLTAKEHWIAHLLICKFSTGKHKYSASQAIINMSRVISEDKRKTSILYENARTIISREVSNRHKGTLVVKDALNGIRIGRVNKQHPKVVSGEWVFFHCGMKRSEEKNQKHSDMMAGENNPRYINVSDSDIGNKAHEYYLKYGCLPVRKWQTYSADKYGFPKSYSKFRFSSHNGGIDGFKKYMKETYNLKDSDFKYIRTKDHNHKIKEAKRVNNNQKN